MRCCCILYVYLIGCLRWTVSPTRLHIYVVYDDCLHFTVCHAPRCTIPVAYCARFLNAHRFKALTIFHWHVCSAALSIHSGFHRLVLRFPLSSQPRVKAGPRAVTNRRQGFAESTH